MNPWTHQRCVSHSVQTAAWFWWFLKEHSTSCLCLSSSVCALKWSVYVSWQKSLCVRCVDFVDFNICCSQTISSSSQPHAVEETNFFVVSVSSSALSVKRFTIPCCQSSVKYETHLKDNHIDTVQLNSIWSLLAKTLNSYGNEMTFINKGTLREIEL